MISHAHRSIFVHIPKTAGQSVEAVFLEAQGLDWDDRESLLLQRNADRDRGPQFLSHLYANEYVDLGYVTAEQYVDYTTFAIVRDPRDRFMSEYRYRSPKGRRSVRDFYASRPTDEFLNATRHMTPQHRFLYDGDKPLVDHVLKFETLAQDWADLSKRVFGEAVPLPHANAPRTESTTVVIDDDVREAIESRYRRDFELFDYALG